MPTPASPAPANHTDAERCFIEPRRTRQERREDGASVRPVGSPGRSRRGTRHQDHGRGADPGRAHTRADDAARISGYIDDGAFDHAIMAFAESYADINDLDHRRFAQSTPARTAEAIVLTW